MTESVPTARGPRSISLPLANALLVTLSLLAIGCGETSTKGANSPARDATHPLLGKEAPAFDLEAQAGSKKVSPSAYSGKVVLVDFWATWCVPCRESFPAYERLVQDHDGIVVLGVSVDEEPDEIPDFIAETKVHFPVGWDRDQRVAQLYKPPSMPTCFMIDPQGIVRHVHTGFRAEDEAAIARQADALTE